MAGGDGCWMRPVWGRDRGLQALRRLAAPRWRRQVDRAGEVELDLEQPPARPRELVEETLARLDLHRPGVGHRCLGAFALEQRDRFGVDREFLAHRAAGRVGVAAVHGQHDLAAARVGMARSEARRYGKVWFRT